VGLDERGSVVKERRSGAEERQGLSLRGGHENGSEGHIPVSGEKKRIRVVQRPGMTGEMFRRHGGLD